ncbi:hypothetical protein LENED_000435 [Lentinula edodes]|uniref:Uncharacterized protein n=1 Tax=Lentinula edodes TaxID=5353 RepID=A0A1Q3DVP3_LENED|nr:hypothetical protein LENED_000435 [Lentinula edodes]
MRRYLKLRREDMIRIIRSRTRRIWLHRQCAADAYRTALRIMQDNDPQMYPVYQQAYVRMIILTMKTSAQANPELDR